VKATAWSDDHGSRIALRAVASGKSEHPVRDVIATVFYCFADQQLDEIAANVADIRGGGFLDATSGSSASCRRRHRVADQREAPPRWRSPASRS
jgi:hypothetical protein